MPASDQTKATVAMCFGTPCGAVVVLTRHRVEMPLPGRGKYDCSWECSGCGTGTGADSEDLRSLEDARERANQHAVFCRALPPDAWPRSVT